MFVRTVSGLQSLAKLCCNLADVWQTNSSSHSYLSVELALMFGLHFELYYSRIQWVHNRKVYTLGISNRSTAILSSNGIVKNNKFTTKFTRLIKLLLNICSAVAVFDMQ